MAIDIPSPTMPTPAARLAQGPRAFYGHVVATVSSIRRSCPSTAAEHRADQSATWISTLAAASASFASASTCSAMSRQASGEVQIERRVEFAHLAATFLEMELDVDGTVRSAPAMRKPRRLAGQ